MLLGFCGPASLAYRTAEKSDVGVVMVATLRPVVDAIRNRLRAAFRFLVCLVEQEVGGSIRRQVAASWTTTIEFLLPKHGT